MKSSKLDCVWSKLSCLGGRSECQRENDERELINKQINERIQKDKQEYRSTHRLLLVGTGSSGKTTILKQMACGLSEGPRQLRVLDIKKCLRDTIVCIASTMRNLKPPIDLQYVENKLNIDFMLSESVTFVEEEDFTDVFFDKLQALWNDDGIKKCFYQINASKSAGCSNYFLDKVESIRDKNYQPTEQDIVRCCCLKTGVSEVKISVDGVKFHIIDAGSQRNERMKWIQGFTEITAILFVTDSSGYDVVSEKNHGVTRLQEALDLFSRFWNNRWLRTVSIVLFLNKQDLLEEKIMAGKRLLEDHFPEFEDYLMPRSEYDLHGTKHPEVARAKCFIRDQFLRLTSTGCRHYCYPHFTCGTDTGNIRILLSDCRDIIQRMHLRQYELL